MTVREIYRLLDAVAPFETQEPYDNSGLLVGSPDQEVRGILFALDVTEAVSADRVALPAMPSALSLLARWKAFRAL